MPSGNAGSFVDLDIVRFFPEGNNAILEGYVQIPLVAIELEGGPDSKAHIDFYVTLEDSAKKEVYQNNWKYEDVITKEMLEDDSRPLIQSFALLLNPGTYTLKLRVTGVKDDVRHEFERQIEAPVERPLLSDILLANQIEVDTTKKVSEQYSTYAKSGLLISPNPAGSFIGATSLVYFYCSIQNQEKIASNVHMELEIIDDQENLVKRLPDKDLAVNGRSRVYVGAFSTGGLKEGSYILRAVAKQQTADGQKAVVQRDKPFSVIGKRSLAASYAEMNEYADFSEEQLDSAFRVMRYLVTNKGKELYNSLSLVGKKNFLHEFWKQRDPVPATPENEFRDDYEKRLEYANVTFSMGWDANAVEGWLTDRGRIYAKFGEPNERLKRPNEYGSPPWELWKYFSTGYSYLRSGIHH
jgi:GWxTD domain-containing protein